MDCPPAHSTPKPAPGHLRRVKRLRHSTIRRRGNSIRRAGSLRPNHLPEPLLNKTFHGDSEENFTTDSGDTSPRRPNKYLKNKNQQIPSYEIPFVPSRPRR